MLGSAMFSRRAASLAWASWSSQSSAAPVMTLLMKPSERERCGRSGPLLVSGSVGSEGAEAAAFNLRCSRLLRSACGQTAAGPGVPGATNVQLCHCTKVGGGGEPEQTGAGRVASAQEDEGVQVALPQGLGSQS